MSRSAAIKLVALLMAIVSMLFGMDLARDMADVNDGVQDITRCVDDDPGS